MKPLGPPRARPGAARAAVVLSLLLIGVAVVGVRDLAVEQGWTNGTTWTSSLLDALDGLSAGTPVVAVGVVVALVGLWLVVTAVRPARRTHVPAPVEADVWVTDRALEDVASAVAGAAAGATEVSARSSRKRLRVTVHSDRPDAADVISSRVTAALDGLSTAPVVVTTKAVRDDA